MIKAKENLLNDYRAPVDLTEKGKKAHDIIMQYLLSRRRVDAGGGRVFYSPTEWSDRGEKYGVESHLVITYDGGMHRECFTYDGYRYELVEELQRLLRLEGMFFEECTGWYAAVYDC